MYRISRADFIAAVDKAMASLTADDDVFDKLTDYSREATHAAFGSFTVDGVPCPLVSVRALVFDDDDPRVPVHSAGYKGGFWMSFDRAMGERFCKDALLHRGVLEIDG